MVCLQVLELVIKLFNAHAARPARPRMVHSGRMPELHGSKTTTTRRLAL